jgi:hypothetical protein
MQAAHTHADASAVATTPQQAMKQQQASAPSKPTGQRGHATLTYYECELERLRKWHPQQSRFRRECVRRSSEGGEAPPATFLHHHDASQQPCSCGSN